MSTPSNLPAVASSNAPAAVSTDVLLVGAGIMSATLGALIRELQPDWSITLIERLSTPAQESSDPWNNAGTGHSALCELNYTPRNADGTVDVSKAITVNEQFQLSRQFWAHCVDAGQLGDPSSFVNPVPHVSFVRGADNQPYLKARYEALVANPLFEGIEYVDDHATFAERLPLMAEGRREEPIALNWSQNGTDVDFGALTSQFIDGLAAGGAQVSYDQHVKSLDRDGKGGWVAKVKDLKNGGTRTINAKFVFVGAGGGAIQLLQNSGIPEVKGFAGFPVSGQFMRCLDEDVAAHHQAKVYGMAAVGAPPMSVPHLDTRIIDGKRALLFGPFAGWSPKFLKEGSVTDLPFSIRPDNLPSMVGVGFNSMALTKYLVLELLKSNVRKFRELKVFYPDAKFGDWELITAGQRVQVVRRHGYSGSLEFGTTVISSADGSISGLLGASPGASTAVSAMLEVLERCFPSQIEAWRPKLKELVPSYGVSLSDNPSLLHDLHDWTDKSLKLV